MATLRKIGKRAKTESKRKLITIYRLKTWKEKEPAETDIKFGVMVKVNGLGDVTGTQFSIENYRCNPHLFYKLESNGKDI